MLNLKSVILASVLSLGLVATANAGTWSVPTFISPISGLDMDYDISYTKAIDAANAQGYFGTAQVTGYCSTPGSTFKFWEYKITAQDPRAPRPWRTVLWKYEQTCL